ncbi:hypothetical protein Y032_0001g351 [Ancylostoma ceylanicum]|nr:hypothetical protein Y032_0001g351 [Ancylostoma ceylanicum]
MEKSDVASAATCTEFKKVPLGAVPVTEGAAAVSQTPVLIIAHCLEISGFVEEKRQELLMGLFDTKYLSASQLKGFNSYKYSCIDSSPISKYISHPFWNWLVNFYPRTWAPNVLTLLGWSLVMGCFLLESVLDYDLTANSVGSENPIPDWFWMTAAICTFIGYTLDGTDGKQARRIGASGPTGELFDHGLDSWSTVPFTITIFSVFGRGDFSVSPVHLLTVLISVQVVFIVTHWEKYNTGILFLSWGYDASQYMLTFVYLFTYFVGYKWYKFYVFGDVTLAVLFEMSFYLCCVGSLLMSAYNMWYSYAVDNSFKQSHGLKFDDVNAVLKALVEAITRRRVKYLEDGPEVQYSNIFGVIGGTSMMEKLDKWIQFDYPPVFHSGSRPHFSLTTFWK